MTALSQIKNLSIWKKRLLAILLIILISLFIEISLDLISSIISDSNSSVFSFSKIRFVFFLFLGLVIYVFRPHSSLFRSPINWHNALHLILLTCIPIILSVLIIPFSQLTEQGAWMDSGPSYWDEFQVVQDGNQYNHLANALLSGHATLDLPESEILNSMENPYDTPLRTTLNAEAHEPIYWDYAFYNGNYYCYFGVLPCLLTFVPFKAATGLDLRTDYAVILFAILAIWALFCLLKSAQQAFFKKLSPGSFLIALVVAYAASGIFEQAFFPRIYAIPILAAYFFATLCLACWIKAKGISLQEHRLSKRYLIIGAICAGCTLSCRPQFIVVAFLAIPLFWTEIKEKSFFSTKSVANTLSIIAPIALLALPVMFYNYIRFDSVTNFGASYNLTGADMTAYVFNPIKILIQTFEYLFLPPTLQSAFPFVATINSTGSQTLLTNEPFYAGFIILNPALLLLFSLFFKKYRNLLNSSQRLSPFVIACICSAFFIIVVACYVSGVNMRYFADFSLYLIVPFILCFWSCMVKSKRPHEANRIGSLALYATCAGILLYALSFFGAERFGALISSAPNLYHIAQSLFLI